MIEPLETKAWFLQSGPRRDDAPVMLRLRPPTQPTQCRVTRANHTHNGVVVTVHYLLTISQRSDDIQDDKWKHC